MNVAPLTALLAHHPHSQRIIVFDLDETLVFARDYFVERPGLQLLLRSLQGQCEVVVWTAAEQHFAKQAIERIDPLGVIEHCIYRHSKWWDGRPGYSKDLRALGRRLDQVLIIENTPDCVANNAGNAILVSDFHGDLNDTVLFRLCGILVDFVRCDMNVQEFLRSHPLLQLRFVACDHGSRFVEVHCLRDDVVAGSSSDGRLRWY